MESWMRPWFLLNENLSFHLFSRFHSTTLDKFLGLEEEFANFGYKGDILNSKNKIKCILLYVLGIVGS